MGNAKSKNKVNIHNNKIQTVDKNEALIKDYKNKSLLADYKDKIQNILDNYDKSKFPNIYSMCDNLINILQNTSITYKDFNKFFKYEYNIITKIIDMISKELHPNKYNMKLLINTIIDHDRYKQLTHKCLYKQDVSKTMHLQKTWQFAYYSEDFRSDRYYSTHPYYEVLYLSHKHSKLKGIYIEAIEYQINKIPQMQNDVIDVDVRPSPDIHNDYKDFAFTLEIIKCSCHQST